MLQQEPTSKDGTAVSSDTVVSVDMGHYLQEIKELVSFATPPRGIPIVAEVKAGDPGSTQGRSRQNAIGGLGGPGQQRRAIYRDSAWFQH